MLTLTTRASIVALAAAACVSLVDCPRAEAQSMAVGGYTRPTSSAPSLSAIGFGLLGGGFLTSAPGLAVLTLCKEGKPCHSDAATALGWILVGPGIPPMIAGVFLIWLDKPHGRNSLYHAAPQAPRFRVAASPLPSGGAAFVSYTF